MAADAVLRANSARGGAAAWAKDRTAVSRTKGTGHFMDLLDGRGDSPSCWLRRLTKRQYIHHFENISLKRMNISSLDIRRQRAFAHPLECFGIPGNFKCLIYIIS